MMMVHYMYTNQIGQRTKARVAKSLRESRSIHEPLKKVAARARAQGLDEVLNAHDPDHFEGAHKIEKVEEKVVEEKAVEEEKEAVKEGEAGKADVPNRSDQYWKETPLVRPELPNSPPYLSLWERFNTTEGEIYRDSADGSAHHIMRWRTVSKTKPRAFYVEHFWTDEEADWVRDVADTKLRRSEVVGAKGSSRSDGVRTSNGMFITERKHIDHAIIQAARRRVSMLTGLAEDNVEATQVLRYHTGQRYLSHPDYFSTIYTDHLARGGQRVATVLAWLDETTSGGETTFPMSSNPNDNGRAYRVKPKKGDAIVFWDCEKEQTPDTYCKGDPYSHHQAEPPGEGATKWVSVFWVRQRRFQ
eukprot:TRINITY_DN32673_c0_g2_i1.p1 TRINITY_DN32673_c0_g2~~TRINITY_DN32673_c0_g2_i1.p1  ORF type:complete len:401 (+),score=149.45 TRINITY_DN32673_c0_g2_i1:128-1204(+)